MSRARRGEWQGKEKVSMMMQEIRKQGVRNLKWKAMAVMALAAVFCGCGREGEQAEKPAPNVRAVQPPVAQQPVVHGKTRKE